MSSAEPPAAIVLQVLRFALPGMLVLESFWFHAVPVEMLPPSQNAGKGMQLLESRIHQQAATPAFLRWMCMQS